MQKHFRPLDAVWSLRVTLAAKRTIVHIILVPNLIFNSCMMHSEYVQQHKEIILITHTYSNNVENQLITRDLM